MRNLPQLMNAVQRNCDISDARYARDYGLCTFLLKMREYYRWENEMPFARALPKDELGDWLKTREQQWDGIEAEDFAPLPLVPVLSNGLTIRGYTLMEFTRVPEKLTPAKKYVYDRLADGRFVPKIAKTFPFAQVVEAYRYLESNAQVGKIVVTVE